MEPDGRSEELRTLYRERFHAPELARTDAFWDVLFADFLAPRLAGARSVLDLGAGSCVFINRVTAARRWAVDLNPDTRLAAAPGVEVLPTRSTDLAAVADGAVDFVFSSHFLEHLSGVAELQATLAEVHRVLSPQGRFLVLMPNLRAVGARYFDFLDHTLPLTDRSLVEALRLAGFEVDEVLERFVPYADNPAGRPGRARVGGGWLTPERFAVGMRWYLRLPWTWRLLGGQMFVSARPVARATSEGD